MWAVFEFIKHEVLSTVFICRAFQIFIQSFFVEKKLFFVRNLYAILIYERYIHKLCYRMLQHIVENKFVCFGGFHLNIE